MSANFLLPAGTRRPVSRPTLNLTLPGSSSVANHDRPDLESQNPASRQTSRKHHAAELQDRAKCVKSVNLTWAETVVRITSRERKRGWCGSTGGFAVPRHRCFDRGETSWSLWRSRC